MTIQVFNFYHFEPCCSGNVDRTHRIDRIILINYKLRAFKRPEGSLVGSVFSVPPVVCIATTSTWVPGIRAVGHNGFSHRPGGGRQSTIINAVTKSIKKIWPSADMVSYTCT